MEKKHTIIVYDENYNVENRIKTTKKRARMFGDTTPFIVGSIVTLALLMIVSGSRNKWMSESRTLSTNLEKIENKYNAMKTSYDSLLVKEEKYQVHYLIGKYSVLPNAEITKDSLISFLEECGIWYPDIVFAQAIQESGMGEAVPDGNSNNLIGMMFPTSRETTSYGKTSSGFAKYKNWQLCILDRILWDYSMFRYKKPSRMEYLMKLKIYGGDQNYINKIESIAKTQYKKQ